LPLPSGSFSAKRFYLFAGGGRKVWKECRRPLLLTRSVNTPVGRVALPVTPPPMIPAVTRSHFLPTLLTRKSEHQWGHRQGQEVGHAERAERELATGVADLLSAGHSPHPLAWSQATSFQSCAAAGRPTCWCTGGALDVPLHSGTHPATPFMINIGDRSWRLLMIEYHFYS
jgi:hypothetical protein